MSINRLMTNICSANLVASKNYYTTLLGLEVAFDSDWFIQLKTPESGFELCLIARNHALVPTPWQQAPQGFYLTFVVADVEAVYQTATSHGYEVVQPPADTFYGQRRLLLKDPDGTLVDVSAPIPNFQFGG